MLGICLGLQLLFDDSEESPGVAGIGLLPGPVRRLLTDRKLPQIGWSTVEWAPGCALAPEGGSAADATYYFVHSYAVRARGRGPRAGARRLRRRRSAPPPARPA